MKELFIFQKFKVFLEFYFLNFIKIFFVNFFIFAFKFFYFNQKKFNQRYNTNIANIHEFFYYLEVHLNKHDEQLYQHEEDYH